jgi:tetratricopeptide (TPR) repeat protein
MRSTRALLFVLVHIAGFIGAANAQTPDQRRCFDRDPDLSISGCTAIIQSGRQTQQNLAVVFYNRGNAYFRKGQLHRAIADYDQAIRLNPNYAEAFNYRATTYYTMGQPDRAIADYDQAIRLNPNFADAFVNRGAIYVGKGQPDRAIEDYAKAFLSRGNAYGSKGQPDRAIENYDQAIRLNPNFAVAFAVRGMAERVNDFETAQC